VTHDRFQGHGDAFDELCAQLTRDLLAIGYSQVLVKKGSEIVEIDVQGKKCLI